MSEINFLISKHRQWKKNYKFEWLRVNEEKSSGTISFRKKLNRQRRSLCSLRKEFLETALQAELEDHHSSDDREEETNRKNGKVSKTLKTNDGEIQLINTFDPEIKTSINIAKGEVVEYRVDTLIGSLIVKSEQIRNSVFTKVVPKLYYGFKIGDCLQD